MTDQKSCGDCAACCETVPVGEIGLPGHTRCPHQKAIFEMGGPGCRIYAKRPRSCMSWNCFWLRSDMADKWKPNRCGFVINEDLDIIKINDKEVTSREIWVLPGHEDDWQKEDVSDLIISLVRYDGSAVLWRMANKLAITFYRDPVTGQWGRSQPTASSKDDEHQLGSVPERLLKADAIAARRTGRASLLGEVNERIKTTPTHKQTSKRANKRPNRQR